MKENNTNMNKEFVTYEQALALKELGFDEPCFGSYVRGNEYKDWTLYFKGGTFFAKDYPEFITVPLYQQVINFLYIYSNKQIDIELKGSDTYEERVRKINQGCEDLRNLQNNKSNQ